MYIASLEVLHTCCFDLGTVQLLYLCILVDDWVSACRNLEVAGSRGRGRPRMTWKARLDGDMKDVELRPGMAMEREKWRRGIMGRTSDPHKRGNIGR